MGFKTELKELNKKQMGFWKKMIILGISAIFVVSLWSVLTNRKPDHEKHDEWLGSSSGPVDISKKIYDICYDWFYKGGIEAGKEEREKGYRYEPEVVLAQPLFQVTMKAYIDDIVKRFGEQYRKDAEQGMKDGFFAGYKDGYNQ